MVSASVSCLKQRPVSSYKNDREARNTREAVDGDDNLDAHLLRVLNVLDEVAASGGKEVEVLVEVDLGERLSGGDIGSSSVHLERADGGDEDDGVGSEARDAALDVAELLHSERATIINADCEQG